jgi:hypothetical protein
VFVHHMRIDHGRGDIFVAQQFLYGANIVAVRRFLSIGA